MKYKIDAKLINHKYQTLVHDNRGHSGIMDLPKSFGGHDTGTSPVEFIVEALAGCTVITYQMIAIQMGVKINDMKVKVTAEKGEVTLESAKILVIVDSCDPEEKLQAILKKTQEMCPVGALIEKANIPQEMTLKIQNREEFCQDA